MVGVLLVSNLFEIFLQVKIFTLMKTLGNIPSGKNEWE